MALMLLLRSTIRVPLHQERAVARPVVAAATQLLLLHLRSVIRVPLQTCSSSSSYNLTQAA